MLTADLIRHTRRGTRAYPRLVEPGDPALLQAAGALDALMCAHQGRSRGELEEALAALAVPKVPGIVQRGLARLLLQRAQFDTATEVPPQLLRADVFAAAAARWADPAAGPPIRWRASVLAAAGQPHGMDAAAVEQALFADLKAHQTLRGYRPIPPEHLLFRYNTAQVQGLLLQAEGLTLRMAWPGNRALRQLLGYLKFFGLLYDQRPDAPEGELLLEIDGPLSMLESATRYGGELANFFPALLLLEGQWELAARLRPRRGPHTLELRLEPDARLRSHYPPRGQWVLPELKDFAGDFNALGCGWECRAADTFVTLPGNQYLAPDLRFTGPGGQERLLELLPHPMAHRLELRLRQSAAVPGYLLACRATPATTASVDSTPGASPRVLLFRRTLLPRQVAKWLGG